MKLYNIVKALQNAKGSIAKQAILNANSEDSLFKAYMKAVYDNSVMYYQTSLPKCTVTGGTGEFDESVISFILEQYAGRKVTGDAAKRSLHTLIGNLNAEGVELLGLLIKRSVGASVGDKMVLKAWPKLFFSVPYLRCSGMSPKVKEEYAALPFFYVQNKFDGSFGYLKVANESTPSLCTRAGSFYPKWLADKLAKGAPEGFVLMGEVLVYEDGKPLSRKVSNGVLNSVLQGGEDTGADIRMVVWDMVAVVEFEEGRSNVPYELRRNNMAWCIKTTSSLSIAETFIVTSLEQAFAINREALLRGEEGTVIKKPSGIWRDSSSGTRDAVKVKVAFQAEYVVTGKYEGEGKAKGMLGGFNVTTSDGLIASNVGSGFSDKQRKEYWEADTDGWIVTLDANDVISRNGSSTESLFLPIFVERRLDKNEADSRERVLEQLQSAKEGA